MTDVSDPWADGECRACESRVRFTCNAELTGHACRSDSRARWRAAEYESLVHAQTSTPKLTKAKRDGPCLS